MNNTALRAEAQSANKKHMVFNSEEHEKHQFTTFLKIKIQTHVLYCIIKASNQNHTKRDEFVSTAYYT